MPKKSMPSDDGMQQGSINFPIRIDRVPTRTARGVFCVKRMRPGLVYEQPTSYGGKWIAVWAGVNPKKRNENVWDLLYQQAS
jgi:hypothetical protein